MQLKSPTKPFVRFLIAGAVNTLFGLLIYSIAIASGLAVWQALLAGILAGLGFNFVTTGGYVFRDLTPIRFFRFAAAYLLVYAVNLGLVTLLSRWMDSAIWIQVILTIPMALGSYFLMSRFVFNTRQ
ncbi:MAG: GtrA family protein [Rhodoferax sp.]